MKTVGAIAAGAGRRPRSRAARTVCQVKDRSLVGETTGTHTLNTGRTNCLSGQGQVTGREDNWHTHIEHWPHELSVRSRTGHW